MVARRAAWKGVLEPILGGVKRQEKPYPALPHVEVGAFMSELRKHERVSARALERIILTACEVYGTWNEIDIGARIRAIPADRMKTDKEHRVPLSYEAIKLLESLPRNSNYKVRGNAFILM